MSLFTGARASAADIITDWGSVKPPPVPVLKPVTLDGKTTALLILDLQKPSCTMERRPRCVATIPHIKHLMDAARAAGALIFYTFPGGKPEDVADPALAPHAGEWVAQSGPDKFLGSDLDQRLKQRGIKTVIVTGTSAQGVVIGTGSGSAQRGYTVIVPVDCMSSEDPYMEQYAAWHMYKGGPAIVTDKTTLTRSDLITFVIPSGAKRSRGTATIAKTAAVLDSDSLREASLGMTTPRAREERALHR
jgi:nicotinamidase-related amidase